MPVDRYTQAALTIIALTLLWIALTLTFPVSYAQATSDEPVRVDIVRINGKQVASADLLPNNEAEAEALQVIVTKR
jgi:hypothetical protein